VLGWEELDDTEKLGAAICTFVLIGAAIIFITRVFF
jgi:hypothetical protein